MATNANYPPLSSKPTDAERIAAIRALFATFNWELDDRQYALEAIEEYVA